MDTPSRQRPQNAATVLPAPLLAELQRVVNGRQVYIPALLAIDPDSIC